MVKAIFGFLTLSFMFTDCLGRKMEAYIVGGNFSDVKDFPHSVSLRVTYKGERWVCGASILNQKILLTAAHCIKSIPFTSVRIQYGSSYLSQAQSSAIQSLKTHPSFDEETMSCDIGIVVTKPLRFNNNVQRVAIFRRSSQFYNEEAYVAGWGGVNVKFNILSNQLKHAKQKILMRRECSNTLRVSVPKGVICGVGESYAARGDSGSALIVRQYIQVGIVSYKKPTINESIVMYTDISYFYNWVTEQAAQLICTNK